MHKSVIGTWRHVAPYEFVFGRQGDEQLFGFEYEDGHVKRFRVHKIEGLRLTDERFVPQYPMLIG
jgi:predicted DNA-binding transcriptional regulator YafY